MPEMPKFSTNTLPTFGERNAGIEEPKWIFLTPSKSSARSTITAFCSYQAMLKAIGGIPFDYSNIFANKESYHNCLGNAL